MADRSRTVMAYAILMAAFLLVVAGVRLLESDMCETRLNNIEYRLDAMETRIEGALRMAALNAEAGLKTLNAFEKLQKAISYSNYTFRVDANDVPPDGYADIVITVPDM